MIYPVLVLVVTAVIGTAVAWFILPRLALVFRQLKIDLPVLTRILIDVGAFLSDYGVIAVPVVGIAVALGLYLIFWHPKTKRSGEAILFSLPSVRRLIREVELARMGFLFGTLLERGVPIVSAITALGEAAGFHQYRNLYAILGNRVEEGHSLRETFTGNPKWRKFIPIPVQEMIGSAEQSGKLSETLRKIGELFEARAEITTKNLIVLLEPLLLVVVWIGVVAVALAVILPIYNLIGKFTP
jgi:type II secretory pathway component PulF